MKTKKTEKGFTLSEVVIAMVIIALVSVTATSVYLSNVTTSLKTTRLFYAVNQVSNVLEIIKSKQNSASEDFVSELENSVKELLNPYAVREERENASILRFFLNGEFAPSPENTGIYMINLRIESASVSGFTTFDISAQVVKKDGKNIYRMPLNYKITLKDRNVG